MPFNSVELTYTMANGGDPRPSQNLRFPAATESIEERNQAVTHPPPPRREIPIANPPQRFTARFNLTEENRSLIHSFRLAALTPQDTETCLQSLFNLMTSNEEEGEVQFGELILNLNDNDLSRMASLITSSSDLFLVIARNKNGSNRLKKLLGRSNNADTLFVAAILHLFFDVMTDRLASDVAIQGLRVFSEDKKVAMYDHLLGHAIHLARDRLGCIILNEIITDLDHPFYRLQILKILTTDAFMLSCDAIGNFVVQNLLKLHDRHCTNYIAFSLSGHCVYLSFNKYGSYIVQKLLETEWKFMVVIEFLSCEGNKLVKLARSDYGNFVVEEALRVMKGEIVNHPDMFWGLVNKLMPFLPLLRQDYGFKVAAFLDSINYN